MTASTLDWVRWCPVATLTIFNAIAFPTPLVSSLPHLCRANRSSSSMSVSSHEVWALGVSLAASAVTSDADGCVPNSM